MRDPAPYAFFLIVAALLASVLLLRARGSFLVLCDVECGENLIALHQARNYELTGRLWGLLENFSTSPNPAAHPFLYTHNVNLGSLIYVALEFFGVHSIEAKQLVALALFLLGIFFAYKVVGSVTRSTTVAVAFLIFFVGDYFHVSAWGLNPLRGLHWLGLFALLHFMHRLTAERAPEGSARLGVMAAALVCFGLGYDFAAIAAVTAVLFYLAFSDAPRNVRRTVGHLAWLAGGLVFAFLVRQLQVIAALGLHFWWTDFSLSAMIKVPFLHNLATLPTSEQIDAFYQRYNVWRPAARAEESFTQIMWTTGEMVARVMTPGFGAIAMVIAGGAAMTGLSVLVAPPGTSRRRLLLVAAAATMLVILPAAFLVDWADDVLSALPRKADTAYAVTLSVLLIALLAAERLWRLRQSSENRQSGPERAFALVAVLSVGAIAGMYAFAPLSLHFYLKHEFPLFGAPIALAKAALVGLAAHWASSVSSPSRWKHPTAAALLACGLAADQVLVTTDNLQWKRGAPTEWMRFVHDRATASFAVQWFPSTAAAFSRNWVAGLSPAAAHEQLGRGLAGGQPFSRKDYMLFGERDTSERAAGYERPDYWLYMVTDGITPFDDIGPPCNKSYLSRAFDGFHGTPFEPKLRSDVPLKAATTGRFEFLVYVAGLRVLPGLWSLDVRTDEGEHSRSAFNCIYQYADIVLKGDRERTPGPHTLHVEAVDEGGRRVKLGSLPMLVEPGAPLRKYFSSPRIHRQPTIDEMKSLSNVLPIADIGPRHVIFDLSKSGEPRRPAR